MGCRVCKLLCTHSASLIFPAVFSGWAKWKSCGSRHWLFSGVLLLLSGTEEFSLKQNPRVTCHLLLGLGFKEATLIRAPSRPSSLDCGPKQSLTLAPSWCSCSHYLIMSESYQKWFREAVWLTLELRECGLSRDLLDCCPCHGIGRKLCR